MFKSIFLFLLIHCFLSTSHALSFGPIRIDDPHIPPPRFDQPRIPTPGEIIDTVQKAAPVSPKKIECDRVREDANRHRATLNTEIARDAAEANENAQKMADDQAHLSRIGNDLKMLHQYEELLANFRVTTTGLTVSQAELKAALLALMARNRDSAFQSLLGNIETTSQDPSMRELAAMVLKLMQRTANDMQALLETPAGADFVVQLVQLVSLSQNFVLNQRTSLEFGQKAYEASISSAAAKLTNLRARILQDSILVSEQDQRTRCDFHSL